MIKIEEILNDFKTVDLKQTEKVKLLNRIDKKFCFNINLLPEILDSLKNDYLILEIENKKINRYKTIYYDTPDLKYYLQHHNGKLNRYKIRHRTYIENNLGFFEIKFKSNKDRTVKKRIKDGQNPELLNKNRQDFLTEKFKLNPLDLKAVIWINFSRITLISITKPERLTIDMNLEYIKDKQTKSLSELIIAEVKQDKKQKSLFIDIMKKYHIREGSLSKYVMGIILTTAKIKKNNFKEKLRIILKKANDKQFITSNN